MKSVFVKTLFWCPVVCALMLAAGCDQAPREQAPEPVKEPTFNTPSFDADSAFAFVAAQVDFGPRPVNTKAHEACAAYLIKAARRYADTVFVQPFEAKAYDGTTLKGTNIIASFHPEATSRILLCAHWDSRPWADQDTERQDEPILAANDGASGVGVLLEVARALRTQPLQQIGVDIVFLDAEDYGKSGYEDSYCLGTQHWAAQPHLPGYRADFGILLDMVGAPNAVFAREGNSMFYASWVVEKVWANAAKLGYGSMFSYQTIGPITDDHLYVNTLLKIPTIDIIHYDPNSPSGTFGSYWHTHKDDMSAIDKNTLTAVGKTVLHTVYQHQASLTR